MAENVHTINTNAYVSSFETFVSDNLPMASTKKIKNQNETNSNIFSFGTSVYHLLWALDHQLTLLNEVNWSNTYEVQNL